ncbi:MAG: hypothetical protein ACK5LS_05005, partial [Propioniciclava sp.]
TPLVVAGGGGGGSHWWSQGSGAFSVVPGTNRWAGDASFPTAAPNHGTAIGLRDAFNASTAWYGVGYVDAATGSAPGGRGASGSTGGAGAGLAPAATWVIPAGTMDGEYFRLTGSGGGNHGSGNHGGGNGGSGNGANPPDGAKAWNPGPRVFTPGGSGGGGYAGGGGGGSTGLTATWRLTTSDPWLTGRASTGTPGGGGSSFVSGALSGGGNVAVTPLAGPWSNAPHDPNPIFGITGANGYVEIRWY